MMYDLLFSTLGIVTSSVALSMSMYKLFKLNKIENYNLKVLTSFFYNISGKQITFKKNDEFHMLIRKVLDNLVATIDSLYEGTNLSASLKLLITSPENSNTQDNIYVVSFLRDSIHGNDRETLKFKYPVNQNHLFSKLMENKEDFVFANNEKKPQDTVYFNNDNSNWKSIYKSVFVYPIILSELNRGNVKQQTFIGFLCLDSKQEIFEGTNLFNDINSLAKIAVENIQLLFKRKVEQIDDTLNIKTFSIT